MDGDAARSAGACPVVHATPRQTAFGGQDWRPNALNPRTLHQHFDLPNPMGKASICTEEFNAPMSVH